MKRQAATNRGLARRIDDLRLEQVADEREQKYVDHPLPVVLTAVVSAMASDAPGLRGAERRTDQIAAKYEDGWQGIAQRIADNTIGAVLRRLETRDLVECLHRMAKAEHRRGNLSPVVLRVRTASIDGKNTATLRWHDLCRLAGVDKQQASVEDIKEFFRKNFPQVQVCAPRDGDPYGLVRSHTVTLVSSLAAYGLHIRNIPGATNEIGALPQTLRELHNAYGRTDIIEMITTDAGNTSLPTNTLIVKTYKWDYFSQIKSEHGSIYTEATRALAGQPEDAAETTYTERRAGKDVTYHIWRCDLTSDGWLDWWHARGLLRVQRITVDTATGETTVGNRYYVCSRSIADLPADECLLLSRKHWRCENETHWTDDAIFHEDIRRLRWSRHPVGILAAAVLRMICVSILAIVRSLSRIGDCKDKPTWKQVMEHFLLSLCGSVLQTGAFDAHPA